MGHKPCNFVLGYATYQLVQDFYTINSMLQKEQKQETYLNMRNIPPKATVGGGWILIML